jgi:hypothetical protein
MGAVRRSSTMPQETKSLVRAIGRWSLAALMLNTIIGASIFGLPSLLAAHLGRFSPVGYLVTAVGIAAIAACLAEVRLAVSPGRRAIPICQSCLRTVCSDPSRLAYLADPDRRLRGGCRSLCVISGPVLPDRRGLGCAVDGAGAAYRVSRCRELPWSD